MCIVWVRERSATGWGDTMVTGTTGSHQPAGSPTAPGTRASGSGGKKRAKHHCIEIQIRSGAVDAMAIEAI